MWSGRIFVVVFLAVVIMLAIVLLTANVQHFEQKHSHSPPSGHAHSSAFELRMALWVHASAQINYSFLGERDRRL